MKTFVSFFAICLFGLQAMAQTPALFNYQGIAKGANNAVLANRTIAVRISLSSNGSVVYSETRSVTTTGAGMFAFQIGSPGVTSSYGNINTASWNSTNVRIITDIDPNNGTSFTNIGNQKWCSVPFAKYADLTAKIADNVPITLHNISGTGAVAGGVLSSSNSVLYPTPAPAVAASTLTLPADIEGKFADSRPAMYLSNTGTGDVVRVNALNGGIGMILEAGETALTTETNSASSEALRVGNAKVSGAAIAVNANGIGAKGVFAESTGNGYALKSSGKVRFQGGAKPPSKGSVAQSTSTGELVWKPQTVACKGSGVWGTLSLPSDDGEVKIPFNVKEYDLGDNFFAVRTFNVPCTGDYLFTGAATVLAYDDAFWVTPKLNQASYIIRVSNPNGGNTYDGYIDSQISPNGKASQIRLSGSTSMALNAGATVEFFIKAKGLDGYVPEVEDPEISIALQQAW